MKIRFTRRPSNRKSVKVVFARSSDFKDYINLAPNTIIFDMFGFKK